jgi:hypothetical protein
MVNLVRYRLLLIVVFTLLSTISCATYFKFNIKVGDTIPKSAPYTLNKTLDYSNLSLIDTAKLYEEKYYYIDNKQFVNSRITYLKFKADGTLQMFSKINDLIKSKKYIEYRFELVDNQLKVEGFFPIKGGQTKLYFRKLSYGYVDNETIVINWLNQLQRIYIKTK